MLFVGSRVDPAFLNYACEILASTEQGLSGSVIVKVTTTHAVERGRRLPHPTYPFQAANKRTALYENLMALDGQDQVRILSELCDHPRHSADTRGQREQLKMRMLRDYPQWTAALLAPEGLDTEKLEETRHWLGAYPEARRLLEGAVSKRQLGVLERNLLDDLRLALELLVKRMLGNDKSLENQLPAIGALVAARGGSPEIGNLMHKAIDYFTKYQNTYVKHDDAVKAHEVDLVFEWTVMLMRHLLRLQHPTT